MYPFGLTPWVWRDPDLWGYYQSDEADDRAERSNPELVGYAQCHVA